MRNKKPIIPKMRDAKPTLTHIIKSVIPSMSREENNMNWHNCDKVSHTDEMSGGGGS